MNALKTDYGYMRFEEDGHSATSKWVCKAAGGAVLGRIRWRGHKHYCFYPAMPNPEWSVRYLMDIACFMQQLMAIR